MAPARTKYVIDSLRRLSFHCAPFSGSALALAVRARRFPSAPAVSRPRPPFPVRARRFPSARSVSGSAVLQFPNP